MTPSVLEHLPDTLTRKEYASLRARAKSLLDGGHVAIRIMLEKASPPQAQRFADRLIRISTLEPQRLRLIQQAAVQRQGATKKEEAAPAFVATLGAIEAKRAELKQLLEHEIPITLKGIQAAAAEGDLRENFEYHMLRDRQELLSARAATLQADLARVQVLEPGAADTSRVNIGTVVFLEGLDGATLEPVTIVGQWDADVERRLFANGTDLAQGLLGRQVGDEITIEGVRARITRIEPWNPSDSA
jgi:transcription elongation factor GreA